MTGGQPFDTQYERCIIANEAISIQSYKQRRRKPSCPLVPIGESMVPHQTESISSRELRGIRLTVSRQVLRSRERRINRPLIANTR